MRGLPLALQITGALLKADPALSAGELADELADREGPAGALRYDDGSGAAGPSVAAAFELSYRRLDDMSARVFRLLPVSPGPDVSTAVAAVLADLPTGQVRRVLAGLAKAHLIESAPGSGRWRMHDLVRLYALRLSDTYAEADGREQARDRLLDYYLDMSDAADDHLRALPGGAVPNEFGSRKAALAWLDAERPNLVAAISMAFDTGRDPTAIDLALILVDYLVERRRFDDLLTITAIGLTAAQRIGDRHRESMALNNLGIALKEVGRSEEAITAYQKVADIFHDMGDQYREALVLDNLGVPLREVGRFEEAIIAHQKAIFMLRQTDDRRSTGMALNNLGSALRAARWYEEAVTAYEEAAATYNEVGDRRREGRTLGNLGVVLRETGRFEDAINACLKSVAIFRDIDDRHGEGAALTNLGPALVEAGRYKEAITALSDAVTVLREIGDHDRERLALDNLEQARAAELA